MLWGYLQKEMDSQTNLERIQYINMKKIDTLMEM